METGRPSKLTYFRTYAFETLGDCNFQRLHAVQCGWYYRLMLETWAKEGFLPANDEVLRKLAGAKDRRAWNKYKDAVLFFFQEATNEAGETVLVHTPLRSQWLMANKSYATKMAKSEKKEGSNQPKAPESGITLEQAAKELYQTVGFLQQMVALSRLRLTKEGLVTPAELERFRNRK
jgi:uncharacterized protein YdaU (DUF1376 family)